MSTFRTQSDSSLAKKWIESNIPIGEEFDVELVDKGLGFDGRSRTSASFISRLIREDYAKAFRWQGKRRSSVVLTREIGDVRVREAPGVGSLPGRGDGAHARPRRGDARARIETAAKSILEALSGVSPNLREVPTMELLKELERRAKEQNESAKD